MTRLSVGKIRAVLVGIPQAGVLLCREHHGPQVLASKASGPPTGGRRGEIPRQSAGKIRTVLVVIPWARILISEVMFLC